MVPTGFLHFKSTLNPINSLCLHLVFVTLPREIARLMWRSKKDEMRKESNECVCFALPQFAWLELSAHNTKTRPELVANGMPFVGDRSRCLMWVAGTCYVGHWELVMWVFAYFSASHIFAVTIFSVVPLRSPCIKYEMSSCQTYSRWLALANNSGTQAKTCGPEESKTLGDLAERHRHNTSPPLMSPSGHPMNTSRP